MTFDSSLQPTFLNLSKTEDRLTPPLGKYVLENRASGQGQRTEILPAKKWNAKTEFFANALPFSTDCPAYRNLNSVQIMLLAQPRERGHHASLKELNEYQSLDYPNFQRTEEQKLSDYSDFLHADYFKLLRTGGMTCYLAMSTNFEKLLKKT